MPVKFRKPINRLAWRVGQKGVSRSDAIARATANVETMRDEGLLYIDSNLDRLEVLMSAARRGERPSLRELYESSDAIGGTAGVFGLPALGKAAFSLCELLSQFEELADWKPEAVEVHINGMRILRRLSLSEDEANVALMLKDLAKLTARAVS